jgi:hypothetical protein
MVTKTSDPDLALIELNSLSLGEVLSRSYVYVGEERYDSVMSQRKGGFISRFGLYSICTTEVVIPRTAG